ncbi:UNVERIFIED_CONTAM: hypothetical protein Slati_3732900 [Sesamum latifolium]|uniref:Uncharacterized protein n=1 Tax=Sesamum latifolium TaxID=2727402 RepID=A0AAW2U3K0_9LAMI
MRLTETKNLLRCENLPYSLILATSAAAPPHVCGHPVPTPPSLLHRGCRNPSDWSPSPSLPRSFEGFYFLCIFDEKISEEEDEEDFWGFYRWMRTSGVVFLPLEWE